MTVNKRLTYKQGIDGYEDVGLRPGVTVGDAICKLADLEERNVENRVLDLPAVSEQEYQLFVEGLEDYFKEADQEDTSVGIFGMTYGEKMLANALMKFLKDGIKNE